MKWQFRRLHTQAKYLKSSKLFCISPAAYATPGGALGGRGALVVLVEEAQAKRRSKESGGATSDGQLPLAKTAN